MIEAGLDREGHRPDRGRTPLLGGRSLTKDWYPASMIRDRRLPSPHSCCPLQLSAGRLPIRPLPPRSRRWMPGFAGIMQAGKATPFRGSATPLSRRSCDAGVRPADTILETSVGPRWSSRSPRTSSRSCGTSSCASRSRATSAISPPSAARNSSIDPETRARSAPNRSCHPYRPVPRGDPARCRLRHADRAMRAGGRSTSCWMARSAGLRCSARISAALERRRSKPP